MPKGQTEAANALGLHYVSRMKDMIMPQAFSLSLPATIGFLVQLLKGTSLAAIVGFIELDPRRADRVEPDLPAAAGLRHRRRDLLRAFAGRCRSWGSRLEMRMARAHR